MGKIILIGGNVDTGEQLLVKTGKPWLKKQKPEILERMLSEMKGSESRIEIITSASKIPEEVGKDYIKALKRLGCKNVGTMHFATPKQADKKSFLERIGACDGLLFSGGDQVLLCKSLLKSKFLKVIKKRFEAEKDFLIAGTSAGAMAIPDIMIARGLPTEALTKGHITMAKGLGILPGLVVDTHFIQRGRFGRLIEATSDHPTHLGIGLGENTAVFFKEPEMVETIGSNLVVLIDASQTTYSNVKYISANERICIQDLKLHILPRHHEFNIPEKKIFSPHVKKAAKKIKKK